MNTAYKILKSMLGTGGTIEAPPVPPVQTARTTKIYRPVNVVTFGGLDYETSQEGDTYIADRYHGQGRTRAITDWDREEIRMSMLQKKDRLKPEKYAVLKPYWAAMVSADDIASNLPGGGYGSRTVDKYYAAMSRALEAQSQGAQCSPIGIQ